MKPVQPIFTADLFPTLDRLLMDCLRSLSTADWERQTLAPKWKIRDVVIHLLDGNIRGLSTMRDGHFGESAKIGGYEELVGFLNHLNADWITAFQRVSNTLLMDLLEYTGKQFCEHIQMLDSFKPAVFSVAWAGESQSMNWFHVAREYTEKWHHQQQIRFALNDQALLSRELYLPYLDTSMRALPHHYRETKAQKNDTIRFLVDQGKSGVWELQYDGVKWTLFEKSDQKPVCCVDLDGEIAWRIFSKEISKEDARQRAKIEGDRQLGEKILDMTAVMA